MVKYFSKVMVGIGVLSTATITYSALSCKTIHGAWSNGPKSGVHHHFSVKKEQQPEKTGPKSYNRRFEYGYGPMDESGHYPIEVDGKAICKQTSNGHLTISWNGTIGETELHHFRFNAELPDQNHLNLEGAYEGDGIHYFHGRLTSDKSG